ncbi:MAG: hypothetical protein JXB42_02060 [Deltaproteobacteria bacterium]|nr:hypothetical protein [Deltaproteobacteria bacterium]
MTTGFALITRSPDDYRRIVSQVRNRHYGQIKCVTLDKVVGYFDQLEDGKRRLATLRRQFPAT